MEPTPGNPRKFFGAFIAKASLDKPILDNGKVSNPNMTLNCTNFGNSFIVVIKILYLC